MDWSCHLYMVLRCSSFPWDLLYSCILCISQDEMAVSTVSFLAVVTSVWFFLFFFRDMRFTGLMWLFSSGIYNWTLYMASLWGSLLLLQQWLIWPKLFTIFFSVHSFVVIFRCLTITSSITSGIWSAFRSLAFFLGSFVNLVETMVVNWWLRKLCFHLPLCTHAHTFYNRSWQEICDKLLWTVSWVHFENETQPTWHTVYLPEPQRQVIHSLETSNCTAHLTKPPTIIADSCVLEKESLCSYPYKLHSHVGTHVGLC